jgi:hypothetical protein
VSETSQAAVKGDGPRTRLPLAAIIAGIVGLLAVVLAVSVLALRSSLSHIGLAINGAKLSAVASCTTDSRSIETALQAYAAKNMGSYPAMLAPWSAASYASNYLLLTGSTNGGPYLATVPSTTNYVIEYDSSGHVWVEAPGRYDQTYNPSQSFDADDPVACAVASS